MRSRRESSATAVRDLTTMETVLNPVVLAALIAGGCSLLLRHRLGELLAVLRALLERLK